MTIGQTVDHRERFRELAAIQLPRLYSLARRLIGDEAEDAVQDALLKAFERFDQLEDEGAAGKQEFEITWSFHRSVSRVWGWLGGRPVPVRARIISRRSHWRQ